MADRRWVGVLVVLGLVAGCSSSGDDEAEAKLDERLTTTTDRSFAVGDGLSLQIEKGDVTKPGRLATKSTKLDPPHFSWYEPVGDPTVIDLTATVGQPVSLVFDGKQGRPKGDDVVPIIWRHDEADGWYPLVIGTKPGQPIIAERTTFSPFSWGWAKLTQVSDWVSGKVRDWLGHRSSRLTCSDGPDWLDLTPPSQDVVHVCGTTNEERAEVQLRNNRGFLLEVEIPKGVAYAAVDGQPEPVRKIVRTFTGHDSVLLLPGQTMSIGFNRPSRSGVVTIPVSLSVNAMLASLFAEAAGGDDTLLGVVTLLSKCTPLPIPLDTKRAIETLSDIAHAAVACASGILSAPGGPASIATEIVAAQHGVDAVAAAADRSMATKIDSLAGKLRLLAAVPLGSKLIDAVADLYTQTVVGGLNSMSPLAGLRGAMLALKDDGLGPLKIGMSYDQAKATGWLRTERTTCAEALGEPVGPGDHLVSLDGPKVPAGLEGSVSFYQGGLSEIVVQRGALAGGVVEPGTRVTPAAAARALRGAGYRVELLGPLEAFDIHEYLTATDGDGDTLALVFQQDFSAGVPAVTTCD